MNPSDHPPVVIGGGVAGIAAAVELARAGLRPILLEARPYLGGRMRSFIHSATGDEIDNGQHLLMGCYHSTFRLLDYLGTRSLVRTQSDLRVEFRDLNGGRDLLLSKRGLPAPVDVLAGMLALRGLSASERLGLLRVAAAVRFGGARPGENVREMLQRLGQSRRACERLWHPMVIATLNAAPEEAAGSLFVEVLRRAILGSATDARLAVARVGLSHLLEPATRLIIDSGGEVRTGYAVSSICARDDGWNVRAAGDDPLVASQVIVALPAPQASRLLVPAGLTELHAWQEAPHSPIVSLSIWLDRPVPQIPEVCALLGGSLQWVFNRTRMTGTTARGLGLLTCTVSAAAAEAAELPETLVQMAERELRSAFPEMSDARVVDSLVLKERRATFLPTPAMEPLRPPTTTRLTGLHLAGDWTATGLPATIEGAAQSGFAAADAVLSDRDNQGAAALAPAGGGLPQSRMRRGICR